MAEPEGEGFRPGADFVPEGGSSQAGMGQKGQDCGLQKKSGARSAALPGQTWLLSCLGYRSTEGDGGLLAAEIDFANAVAVAIHHDLIRGGFLVQRLHLSGGACNFLAAAHEC